MGMGYGANMEFVIEHEEVEKIVPEQWKKLSNLLDEVGTSLDDVAQSIQYDDVIDGATEEQDDAIMDAFEELQEAFKTQTDISLELYYHDLDNQGDRYDEVDGSFFVLNWTDVFEYTPQMKALLSSGVKADMKMWVTYG